MSTELERLHRDLERDDVLLRELAAIGSSTEPLERWLRERGYGLSDAEVAGVVSALGEELSDEELDAVAGGTGGVLDLQISADRRSHLLTTLSNIMGGMHDTADTTIGNIR